MDIPYKLIAAVPPQDRWMQMYHAIQQGYPTLADHAIDDAKRLQLVCYGPSLRETWKDIDPTLPIMTVSGALKFLAERGITPTWHVQMDPRREQPRFVDPPVPGVHYLMASVCPPETWKVLQGQQVTLWHANSGEGTLEFLARHAPAKVEGDRTSGCARSTSPASSGSATSRSSGWTARSLPTARVTQAIIQATRRSPTRSGTCSTSRTGRARSWRTA
jgi:hypothetical protein